MGVSAETGAAGSGSLDHLNDPDKRSSGHQISVQSAAGDLCLQVWKRLQGLCAQPWSVHICCSERQSSLGVSCSFCWNAFKFLNVFVVYFCFFFFAGMFSFLNSWACSGRSSIWALVDPHASGSWSVWWPGCTACELLYQFIDAGMSSLNLAAVKWNLDLVWTEFLGWLLGIFDIITLMSIYGSFLK